MNFKSVILRSLLILAFVLRVTLGLHYALLDYEMQQNRAVLGVTMERANKLEIKDGFYIYEKDGITVIDDGVYVNNSVFSEGRLDFEYIDENRKYVKSAHLNNIDSTAVFPDMAVAGDEQICEVSYANYHEISSIECGITTLSGYGYELEVIFNDDSTEVIDTTLYSGSILCSAAPDEVFGLSTRCKAGEMLQQDLVKIARLTFGQDNWVLAYNDPMQHSKYLKEVSILDKDSADSDLIVEGEATGYVLPEIGSDKVLCSLTYVNYHNISIADCDLSSFEDGAYDLSLYYSDETYEKLTLTLNNGTILQVGDDDDDDQPPVVPPADDDNDDQPPVVQINVGTDGGSSSGNAGGSSRVTNGKNTSTSISKTKTPVKRVAESTQIDVSSTEQKLGCGAYIDTDTLSEASCEIVSKMKEHKIFTSEEFRPNGQLMRYEAALLVLRAVGANATCDSSVMDKFQDIDKNAEYYGELCIAVTAKIITGYKDDNIHPKMLPAKKVTYREFARMLLNGFESLDENSIPKSYHEVASALDFEVSTNNDWFGLALQLLVDNKMVDIAVLEKINLEEKMNRLQVAELLVGLIDYSG